MSKSDPFIVLYTKVNHGEWIEIGRTEVITNTLKYDINSIHFIYKQFKLLFIIIIIIIIHIIILSSIYTITF